MLRYDLIVIGAGPAGLSAAIESAKLGMNVIVYDENSKPGGQLFKQIHKFFGSKEHKAKIRGFKIGEMLLKEAEKAGVKVVLNATVMGIFDNKEITVMLEDKILHVKGDTIVVATGASENMIPFEGWTLPGVIGAGAAQTMMNINAVLPGKKILMVGSGNVGLVVSFQLEQAGCKVSAVIDAAPKIGGYGVHAAKVARTGVPFYLSHTVLKAHGKDYVTGVTIGEVDKNWNVIEGSEKYFDVDTICLAVGLSPMSQLTNMAGCDMKSSPMGAVPDCSIYGETSVKGIFAAGDVAGIEEASSAMITGKIAGIGAAKEMGFLDTEKFNELFEACQKSLNDLRQGMFSHENKGKDIEFTDENYPISKNLLKYGYLNEKEINNFPSACSSKKGIHPVIECTQNIPCNPCQESCKFGCIVVGKNITGIPQIDDENKCTGCGMCVASCSGQAIFLVNDDYDKNFSAVSMPYEFYPLPEVGEKGIAYDRKGEPLCQTEVIGIKTSQAMDKTAVLTIKVPKEMSMSARFFKGGDLDV